MQHSENYRFCTFAFSRPHTQTQCENTNFSLKLLINCFKLLTVNVNIKDESKNETFSAFTSNMYASISKLNLSGLKLVAVHSIKGFC